MSSLTREMQAEWNAWQRIVQVWPTIGAGDINDKGNVLIKLIVLWGEIFSQSEAGEIDPMEIGLAWLEVQRNFPNGPIAVKKSHPDMFDALLNWAKELRQLRSKQDGAVIKRAMETAKAGVEKAKAVKGE